MLSVNERALEITEVMVDWAEELKVEEIKLKNKATVIDCGVNVTGSYEAGLMFTDVCMGGLSTSNISVHKLGDVALSFIDVTTDHPSISCLASQMAGWQINVGKYVAMGSGPARALSLKPKKIYKRIGYNDNFGGAVIALESNELPDEKVMGYIAKECGIDVENIVAVVAPTASIVGSVQVSGRVVEAGVHKLNELGYDTNKIICGAGVAPIAPVLSDNTKAMGSTNDSVIYYGSVNLTLKGFDEGMLKKVTSSASESYGRPLYEIFKEADYDFYKIDVDIFAPAEMTVNDLETGKTYHTGYLNDEVILKSYEIKNL